jgi:hypothetical protein
MDSLGVAGNFLFYFINLNRRFKVATVCYYGCDGCNFAVDLSEATCSACKSSSNR